MRRLSSLDAQFLAAETRYFGSHYSGPAIFETEDDTVITAATMRKRVATCIDQLPPLHWKVVDVPLGLDHPVFVETEVNLDEQIFESTPAVMTCEGAPLLATYPGSVVFDGFALNITVVSYQDGLDIGIVGDAGALPDAWDLLADFGAELDELSALVDTEGSAQ